VCLDSNAVQVKVRDAEQFDWLVDHLKKRSREPTWTFVIFHHPLFSAHPSRAISDLRWVWAPLFLDPANRVDGVLTGHDHFYARNFRMGTLADGPQQGVLFLTSAGGGASLYPCSARDYVASERSAHHFTLFDFDGDHVTLMAIDTTGKEFDHYVLTKDPTPPEEFCSYEVEEFRQFLRKALAITPAPVGQNASQPAEVDVAWTVPTRFKVPVAGMLRWQPKAGWDLKEAEVPFQLDAGQALHIPLRATVAAGPLAGSPKLTIVFEPGRFHNHTVEAYPQILGGPSTVTISRAGSAVRVDGNLDETVWRTAPHLSLAGLPPRGGRSDRLQVVADSERIYFGAQVDNVAGNIGVKVGPVRLSRADVLVGESLRVTLTDGKRTHRLTVSPGGLGYVDGDKTEPTVWQAAVGTARGGWAAELSVSRRLFADWSSVSLNVVHRQPTSKEAVEWQLCPGFTLGNSPDRIPDVRPAEIPARYALRLVPCARSTWNVRPSLPCPARPARLRSRLLAGDLAANPREEGASWTRKPAWAAAWMPCSVPHRPTLRLPSCPSATSLRTLTSQGGLSTPMSWPRSARASRPTGCSSPSLCARSTDSSSSLPASGAYGPPAR
jgi:hypothetical protein